MQMHMKYEYSKQFIGYNTSSTVKRQWRGVGGVAYLLEMLQLVLESASYKQYLTFSLKYPFVFGGKVKASIDFRPQ